MPSSFPSMNPLPSFLQDQREFPGYRVSRMQLCPTLLPLDPEILPSSQKLVKKRVHHTHSLIHLPFELSGRVWLAVPVRAEPVLGWVALGRALMSCCSSVSRLSSKARASFSVCLSCVLSNRSTASGSADILSSIRFLRPGLWRIPPVRTLPFMISSHARQFSENPYFAKSALKM